MATRRWLTWELDPNGDGDESDDTLYFITWNRAAYAWNKPVAVAVTGPVFTEGPVVLISLTRDSGTDAFGLAYTVTTVDGASTMMLAISSDGGVSWKSQSISGSPFYGDLYKPLGLWNGVFHFVFMTDNSYFADSSPVPRRQRISVYHLQPDRCPGQVDLPSRPAPARLPGLTIP